jgi:hypothetical protein
MVSGPVEVDIPHGDIVWYVTVGPGGVQVEGESIPNEPPPNPDKEEGKLDLRWETVLEYLELLSGMIGRLKDEIEDSRG